MHSHNVQPIVTEFIVSSCLASTDTVLQVRLRPPMCLVPCCEATFNKGSTQLFFWIRSLIIYYFQTRIMRHSSYLDDSYSFVPDL